jgi:thiol:disulfide interchange protein DsbD
MSQKQNLQQDKNGPEYYEKSKNMKPNPIWKRISLFQYPLISLALFIFIYVFIAFSAEPQQSEHVKARLISEVKSIQPGESFYVALWLKMDKLWHTYWKNPGDSGLPTKIEWNLPDGFVPGVVQWPYPKRFEKSGLVSFGYEGEVFLITQIEAPKAIKSGTNAKLSASVDWLVCKERCTSGHVDLVIKMPVKDKNPKINRRWASHFRETRKKLSRISSEWEVNAFINKDQILIHIDVPSEFKGELKNITFFPEQGGIINYSGSQNLKRAQDGYILEVQRSKLSTRLPARLKGVLLSPEGWGNSREERALHIDVPLMNVN